MGDHFDRLGLPRRFALDLAAVEQAYIARSRAIHPDYHLSGSTANLSASLELTAALNEAYNILRDSFTRAEYLVALYGGPSAQQEKALDAEFLEEMMEYQEQVETADEDEAYAIRGELLERQNDYECWIAGEFNRLENLPEGDPSRPQHLLNIRRSLNALKTIRSLLRNLPDD
jgi:molecular chaperone HscB